MKTALALLFPALALSQADRPVTFVTTAGAFTYSGTGCPDGSLSINYARENGVAAILFTPPTPFSVQTPNTLDRSCTIRLDVRFPSGCFNTTLNHTPSGNLALQSAGVTAAMTRSLSLPGLASGSWVDDFRGPQTQDWISLRPWTVVSQFGSPTVVRLTSAGQLRLSGSGSGSNSFTVNTWDFDVRATRECCELPLLFSFLPLILGEHVLIMRVIYYVEKSLVQDKLRHGELHVLSCLATCPSKTGSAGWE